MKKDSIVITLIEKYKIQLILFFSILIPKMLINLVFKGPTVSGGADEFGVISGAAFFGGCDWSDVTSHVLYYGWGYSFVMAPVFLLFENMSIIYQGLLFYNAVLLALNAVICYNILHQIFKIDKKQICALIAVTSSCLFSSMVSNDAIINENPLIFLVWLVLYIILILQQKVEKNESIRKLSVVLGIVLCYGLTVHTRFIMIWGAVFIAVLSYYVFRKKFFVNIPLILLVCVLGYLFIMNIIALVQDKLWLAYLSEGELGNSMENLGSAVKYLEYLTSFTGIRAYFSCIVGQLFVMGTYSGGILIFFIVTSLMILREFIFSCKRRFKKSNIIINENNALIYTSIIFIAALLLGTLFSGAVFSLNSTVISFERGLGSKWLVYQRYWDAYCGIAVMLTFAYCIKNRKSLQSYLISTMFSYLVIIIAFFALVSPHLVGRLTRAAGSFICMTPLMFRGLEGVLENKDFIILAIVGIILALIFGYLLLKKKFGFVSLLLLLISLFCYGTAIVNWEYSTAKANNEKYQGVKWVLDDCGINPKEYTEIYTDFRVPGYTIAQFELNRYQLLMREDYIYNYPENDDVKLLLTNKITYEMVDNWSLIYSQPNDNIYLLVRNGELSERLVSEGKRCISLNDYFSIDKLFYSSYIGESEKITSVKLTKDVIIEQNIYITEEMLTGEYVTINLYFYNKSLIPLYENVYISVIQGETEEVRCVSLSAIEHDEPLKVILQSSKFKSGEARIVLTCPEGIGKAYAVPYMVAPKNDTDQIKEENKIIVNGEKINQQLYYSIIKAGNNSGVNVANRILEKHDLDVISTKSYTNVTKELKINQTIYLNFDEKNDGYTNIGLEFIYNLIDMKDSDKLFIEISQGDEVEQFWYKKKHLENKNIIRVAVDGKKFHTGAAEIKIYLKTQGETSVIKFMILREDYPGDLFSLTEHPLVKNGKLYPSKLLVNSYLIYNKHTAVRFPTRKSPKYY